jgi:hypothetical protein
MAASARAHGENETFLSLSETGGPAGIRVDPSDHLINLQERILYQLTPATRVELITTSITQDTVQTLAAVPMPEGLQVWALKNNSAKTVFVWFQRTNSLPQNYLTFAPGEFRAYQTVPVGGIYCLRTLLDSTASVTLEMWH